MAQPVPQPAQGSDPMLREAKALFEHGREAFARGEFREAGMAFERASTLAPKLVPLRIDAVIAFQHAALAEVDLASALVLCEAVRRNAEAVHRNPQATVEHREHAQDQLEQAQSHCNELTRAGTPDVGVGPCLTDVPCLSPGACLEPDLGVCLSPPPPDPRGCGRRRDGSVAMLGSLLLLGLRSRQRRDALERMADRLPPDVAARLRRTDEGSEEPREE